MGPGSGAGECLGPDDVGVPPAGGKSFTSGPLAPGPRLLDTDLFHVCHLLGLSLPAPPAECWARFRTASLRHVRGTSRPCRPEAAPDIRHLIDTAAGARERVWAVTGKSRCPAAGGRARRTLPGKSPCGLRVRR